MATKTKTTKRPAPKAKPKPATRYRATTTKRAVAPAPAKAKGKVKRQVRKVKAAAKRAVQAMGKRVAKKYAPGRDRRRARTSTGYEPTPKTPTRKPAPASKPIAQRVSPPQNPGSRKAKPNPHAAGHYYLHRLSGNARSGEWFAEVQIAGQDPQMVWREKDGGQQPYSRPEKAERAVLARWPNLKRRDSVTTLGEGPSAQALATNKVAEREPSTHALTRVSGVPTTRVSGIPDDEVDAGDEIETIDAASVIPLGAPRRGRYQPPPLTDDVDLDLDEHAQLVDYASTR